MHSLTAATAVEAISPPEEFWPVENIFCHSIINFRTFKFLNETGLFIKQIKCSIKLYKNILKKPFSHVFYLEDFLKGANLPSIFEL